MDEKDIICSQCNQKIEEGPFYLIYQVVASTPEKDYTIGMSRILSELNDYIASKFYHLSASELILLRPDIVLECLREKYEKEITGWYLKSDYICYECYDVYLELMPLR